jgi:hypothetical protein
VRQLKELIAKRQKLLSTGEKPRVGKEDSQVVVAPHDMILLIRKFRDSGMNGVFLEDDRTLEWYGLTELLDDNLFLKRSNPMQECIAEILLIDEHHLTPGQKARMRSAVAERDIDYFRHCIQM